MWLTPACAEASPWEATTLFIAAHVDFVLSWSHNTLVDRSLLDKVPYFQAKGLGIISASPLAMGLLTERVRVAIAPGRLGPALPLLPHACAHKHVQMHAQRTNTGSLVPCSCPLAPL